MTREELTNSREYQITSEATKRYYNLEDDEENNFITGFEQGAEWADEYPNPQTIAEFLHKEKGYSITLNGEIPTFEEAMKGARMYNAHMKKQMIEMACRWLTLNIGMLLKVLDVEYNTNETDIKNFIEDFKKAMEE